jgi:hypothetical protein
MTMPPGTANLDAQTSHHIHTLRRHGMPYRAISIAVAHFTGVHVSEWDARYHCRAHGFPRDESRVRTRA